MHRLEQDGWIAGKWSTNDEGRRVKSYAMTSAGRRKLTVEKEQWARIVLAVGQVLESA